ncbi:MAG TPA: septum formation initiator family protein [Candidatus Eisenbacteria bacterium]|jgi:cell division protein FtsL|nr:septum formation initiator family protein [Candidatus Eisenbacteria bacterium]
MAPQDRLSLLWTQYGRALLGICVFGLFLHDIFGAHGYLAMRRTQQEIERVQGEIARLNKENTELSQEVKALKSDPHKIESIARDELGLAKPGEVIIKIPKSEQIQPPAAKP